MRSSLILLSLIAICIAAELNQDVLRQLEHQNCGVPKESTVIRIGDEVIPGSRPWMALIRTNLTRSEPFSCLGTLITNQFVLTAAHCVSNIEIESVRLGEHQLTTDEECIKAKKTKCLPNIESFGIERIIIHDKYEGPDSYPYDIALLKLNRKVDFKDHISPICLPINATLEQQATSLETLLLTAWGTDKDYLTKDRLREITVDHRVENRIECARTFPVIGNNHICIFKDPNVLCNGISGSPLSSSVEYSGTKRFVQFAVVHLGVRDCRTVVGLNVAKLMPWIANVLSNL